MDFFSRTPCFCLEMPPSCNPVNNNCTNKNTTIYSTIHANLCTTQNTQNKNFSATKPKSNFGNVKLYKIFDDSKYDSFATTQEFKSKLTQKWKHTTCKSKKFSYKTKKICNIKTCVTKNLKSPKLIKNPT